MKTALILSSVFMVHSAMAVTLNPVANCIQSIHSGFAITSVQLVSEEMPPVESKAMSAEIQATLTEKSLSLEEAPKTLGSYVVKPELQSEPGAPKVYTDADGTFKLTIDTDAPTTVGGLTQATLEITSADGAVVSEQMVCQFSQQ